MCDRIYFKFFRTILYTISHYVVSMRTQNRVLLLTGTLALVALITSMPNIYAPAFKYGIMTDGSAAGGFPDPGPGDPLKASAATNNPAITKVIFKFQTDGGTLIDTSTDTSPTAGGGADCLTTATKYTGGVSNADVNDAVNFRCFSDSFTVPGDAAGEDLAVQAFFCTDSQECIPSDKASIRAVSLFVTPESPIGAIAMIVASLGALGAFVGLRYKPAIKI